MCNKPESEYCCSSVFMYYTEHILTNKKKTKKQKKTGLGTRYVGGTIFAKSCQYLCDSSGFETCREYSYIKLIRFVLIGNLSIKRILHSYFRLVSVQIRCLKIFPLMLQHGNHHKKLHRNCHLLWSPTLQLCTVDAKLRRLLKGMNMW